MCIRDRDYLERFYNEIDQDQLDIVLGGYKRVNQEMKTLFKQDLTQSEWSKYIVCLLYTSTLVFGDPTSGWPSLMTVILFLGGFQLLTIGILGKYIGKIFMETKKRPIYVIKEKSK